jgi:membrane associated rhomboid family serine protease
MNGYALYNFGRLMELLANRAHLAIVFLLSAIGGGILSTVLSPEGLSVGASGGIVGLIGYLVIYAFLGAGNLSRLISESLPHQYRLHPGFRLVPIRSSTITDTSRGC